MADRTLVRLRPRNKYLNDTLMAKKAASGVHKLTEKKREKTRLQREIDRMLEEDKKY